MDQERFEYLCRISGQNKSRGAQYYGILDKSNPDHLMWVDCTDEQFDMILNALNGESK